MLLAGAAGLISRSSHKAVASEIFRTPAAVTGANPYTPPVAAPTGPSSAASLVVATHLAPPAAALAPPPKAPVNSVATFTGNTPGLYGGTRQLATCNPAQMISFLTANPQKAAAWASVEGITTAQIPSYISQLTSVVLRMDTRVTNHGFIGGRATTIPEVLQAGTAVLVDRFGVPRSRCFCGNPLTPPVAVTGTPSYGGTSWPAFTPSRLAAVVPAPKPVPALTLVDVNTGAPFVRPTGTTGAADQPAPPNALAGSPLAGSTSSQAAGGTPDLTGSWNPGSGPAWVLQASPDLSTLHATWHGGPPHEGLVGTFDGTLQSDGHSYTGVMHVTEGSLDVTGTMIFVADSADHIMVTFHQSNGNGGTVQLSRESSGSSASASSTSTSEVGSTSSSEPGSTTTTSAGGNP